MRLSSYRMVIFFCLLLFVIEDVSSQTTTLKPNPSIYLSNKVWEQVQEYLIPDDHPMKAKLDEIFSRSRALADHKRMAEAGFEKARLQKMTQIVVTRHPELPGYVIKAYLDSIQLGPKGRPEHYYFIERIIGSRLVRKSIQKNHYENLLKVPKKWLYLLPDDPSPPNPSYVRRMFILIEEDMDIYNDNENVRLWRSKQATKKLLRALYVVTKEVRLADSTNARNCPFSRDGRIAFIDTQMYNRKIVKYEKMSPYLSRPMRTYWRKLTHR